MGLFRKTPEEKAERERKSEEFRKEFYRKKEIKKQKLYKNVLVTTTLDLDQPFETIGMVTAEIKTPSTKFDAVMEQIQKEAAFMEADAVIGFKSERTRSTLTKQWTQTAYGTAVKYKKENAGD